MTIAATVNFLSLYQNIILLYFPEQVLITPFRKMVVPPPMAAYSLQPAGPVNQVMHAPPPCSNDIAVVTEDGNVAFYRARNGKIIKANNQTKHKKARI